MVQPASSPAPAESTETPAKKSSSVRLYVLLTLLAIFVGVMLYEFQVAAPGVTAAYEKIEKMVEERNKLGVKDGDLVRPIDVQTTLAKKPSSVQEFKDHTIEAYAYGGLWPVWKRNYITVLYIGDKSEKGRRYNTHYVNQFPPAEDLPSDVKPIDLEKRNEALPRPEIMQSEEDKAAAEKGEKAPAAEENPAEAPAEEKPAAETPAVEAPAAEAPAEE